MPIYEYKCPECGTGFEKFCVSSRQSDRAQTCPKCGCPAAHRVLSRVGSVGRGGESRSASCGTRANSRFS